MKTRTNTMTRTAILVTGFLLLTACATSPRAPEGPIDARVALTALQSNSQLATRAPVELKEAEAAVKAAEMTDRSSEQYRHRLLMADQKVEIARARAQSRQYEDERTALSRQSERARLEARTLEADRARRDAQYAREDASSARTAAESSRAAADSARADAATARDDVTASQAEVAASRTEAARARNEAAASQAEVAAARAQSLELQRQIAELNARETDRGLVVTLGDVLFATGQSNLTGAAGPNLNKLAAFLDEYRDRTVLIEGHTDSVGSADSNQLLSQRRAESVRTYLVGQGVAANRLTSSGLGQGSPVATNNTATGRQQNRRVEVIISNVARAN
ncbi:MAG: OmpA family protein [Wenzhouxiangella sp.]